MSDEKIIQHAFGAAKELPDCPIRVESSSPIFHCNHPALAIDTHERAIRCAKCDAVLDPFDYLANCGRSIQMAWRDYKYTRAEITRLNESVDRLKREEKRLKASIRRQQQKAPILDVRGGL
jgi:hypothetical protein